MEGGDVDDDEAEDMVMDVVRLELFPAALVMRLMLVLPAFDEESNSRREFMTGAFVI